MLQPLGDSSPTISVVVRTLGSVRLGDALGSLAAQTRRDFEVVVVDMSDGRIEELLDRFATRLPYVRRVAPAGRRTRPAALNVGVRAARAPLLAVLDEDNLYDPDHVETLVGGLEKSGADYVYTGVRHATYEPSGSLVESTGHLLALELRQGDSRQLRLRDGLGLPAFALGGLIRL